MDETTTEWKGYKIVRVGKNFRILNKTQWIDNTFLTRKQAIEWINLELKTNEIKDVKRELNALKREPDIRKRARKYKEICKRVSQQ